MTEEAESALAKLEERLDAILRGPDAIEAQTFFRVVRPILALAGGWRAQLQTKETLGLVAMLRTERNWGLIRVHLGKAMKELEANIGTLERVTIVRKQPPYAHVMWLRRVVSVFGLTAAAAAEHAPLEAIRAATKGDPSLVLPPLSPLRDGSAKQIEDNRLVDLELAAIDHLMAAARAETLVLGRRRRLLLAARQRLLEASAALPIERVGVSDRARWLAMEVTRIDRLEALGVAPDISLVHQMRQALTRRDSKKLYGSLSALDANALGRGDREVFQRTGKLLDQFGEREARESAERSAKELLGANVAIIHDAVAEARADAEERTKNDPSYEKRIAAGTFLRHLPEDAGISISNAALAVDGFFEVGGALSPVRITEEGRVQRVVKHPTQDLTLLPAEDVNDLKDAIIGDPRAILMDLAIGRLFARRFVRDEVIKKNRVVMHGEVRVYVLDGSGSMLGKRARVRDAILIAELSTLVSRLENPRDVKCTLFYRYFDEALGPQRRVETQKEAQGAIRDVVRTDRQGGTDIQLALVSSLEQIAESRAGDPELARAQVVLITDGEADVDEATIVGAREKIGGIPVGVSVIALGAENPALRGLVARQRAKGEAAFYHYLDDDDCEAIISGTVAGRSVHAPEKWDELAEDPRALEDELGGLVDELESIDRKRDVDALEQLEEEAQARRDLGLEAEEAENQGDRARVEALRKDRVALNARFARWFPRLEATPGELPEAGTPEREDLDAVTCALASVAEVVGLLSGSEFARQADAIELLERLLPDARLTPARYRAVLREYPAAVAPAIDALYAAIRSKAE